MSLLSSSLSSATKSFQSAIRNVAHNYGAVQAGAGAVRSGLQSLTMKALTTAVGQAIPFATRNGFRVVEAKTGYLKASIALKGNKNHIGTMYAGALFTVAELPGGIICMLDFGEAYYPVLKEMQVQYLDVAKTDVEIEYQLSVEEMRRIEACTDKDGKCDFILEGELKDTAGKVVARSKGFYQLRAH